MAAVVTTQTFLERLSNRVASELGDPAADYTANGKTIFADQRESAINRAVNELYDIKLGTGELTTNIASAFMNKYLIYRSIQVFVRVITDPALKVWDKPDADTVKIRKMISIEINSENPLIIGKIASPYTDEQYHSATNNQYSNLYPSKDKPWFFEFDTSFSLEIGADPTDNVILQGTLRATCLIAPVYQAFGTTLPDILAPRAWETEIVELAKAIVQGSHQV